MNASDRLRGSFGWSEATHPEASGWREPPRVVARHPAAAAHSEDVSDQKGKLTHEIRRAVASTMLLNGTAIHVVKEILGHSTIKTTELYAFSNEEAKREASKNALV